MTFLRFLFSKYFFKHIFYILVIVLFAIFFGILALSFITDHGDYVKVPDLKGKTLDSVAIELDNLDLKYIILDSGNYNPNYKIFSVLDQQPKFDSKVKEENVYEWKLGKKIVPKRTLSGGTSFINLTNWLNKKRFDGVIVCTDMRGSKPGPMRSGVQRIWITTKRFAKKIPFQTNEKIITL